MKWLEEPQGEAERLVREGLDLAAQRLGDELAHRRVWSKVAEAAQMPEPRSGRRWIAVSAAATVLAAAGLFAYIHVYRTPASSTEVAAVAPEAAPPAPTAPATSSGSDQQLVPLETERSPGHVVSTQAGERLHVALGGGAVAELDENSALTWDKQHRPSVQRGVARLSVPHQPPGWRFSVTAGPYVVTVVGTKFEVQVSSRTVGVAVTEGVVEVWRNSHSTRLVAGDAWHGPMIAEEPASAVPTTSTAGHASSAARVASAGKTASSAKAASSPSERPQATSTPTSGLSSFASSAPSFRPAATTRGLQEADQALQSGDVTKAVDILAKAAQGTGPAAENAAYEMARITRYNLNRPRQAIVLWEKYRTRFPSGLLRTETDLSIVDTLSQLGEVRAALAEADAFLAKHPRSERRQDVQRLTERLRAAQAASEVR